MSNEVDIFQQGSTAVSTLNRRDDGFTGNITASSTTSKRISIRGGLFRLMVNGKELDHTDQRHMDVVIVNASPAVHRTFYAGNYNASQKAAPPVCWSSDSIAPDASVPEAQATSCASCPQNIKGSGANGSKACRYSRRIAVVRANQLNESSPYVIDSEVFQVTLPAQSIFGNGTTDKRPLHEYTDYVKANGENLMSVVTRMAFDTNSATPRLGFRAVGRLNDEQYAACATVSSSDDAKRAVTLTVATNKDEGEGNANLADQFAPAPPAARAPAPTQPAAQPVPPVQNVATPAADPVPEPTVRSASNTVPKAAPKVDLGDVSLDDLVGEWGA